MSFPKITHTKTHTHTHTKVELSITLLGVNNFNSKQKMAWSICFIIYPKQQLKSE